MQNKEDQPVQQQLFLADQCIEEHKAALAELRANPRLLPTTQNIFEACAQRDMERYHEYAIRELESGLDPLFTIDSLSEEELEQYMRSQGIFVCYRG
jgi:hypothetical protein